MSEKSVEMELQEATGVKPKKGEKPQAYYKRMCEGIDDLSSDQWENLSDPAQKWFNNATKDSNASRDISDFPALAATTTKKADDKKKDDKKAEGDGKKDAAADKKDEKKADDKKKDDKPAAADKKPRSDKDGVMTQIKQMLLKNPKMSADDIAKKLADRGGPASSKQTITTVRSDFRHSLRVIVDAGLIKLEL